MIEFGKTLKAARESKGLTTAKLAEITNVMQSTIQDLEAENFSQIAAPIYGRGFVKLYCEAVGLDPKPMIDEFMAIYNGEHVTIRERAVETETPPDKPITPEPKPEPQPEPQPEPLFAAEPKPEPKPEPLSLFATEPEPTCRLSRYSTPLNQYTKHISSIALGRGLLVALLGCLLLVALGYGLKALYHATTLPTDHKPVALPAEPTAKSAEPTAKPAEPSTRTPQQVPSLYID